MKLNYIVEISVDVPKELESKLVDEKRTMQGIEEVLLEEMPTEECDCVVKCHKEDYSELKEKAWKYDELSK